MTTAEVILLCGLAMVALLCVAILIRAGASFGGVSSAQVDALGTRLGEFQAALASGLAGLRDESVNQARAGREELGSRLDGFAATLTTSLGQIGTAQTDRLEALARSVSNARIESQNEAAALRGELLASFGQLTSGTAERLAEQAKAQGERLDGFARSLAVHREAAGTEATRLREEVGGTLTKLGQRLDDALAGAAARQGEALKAVTETIKQLGDGHEQRGQVLSERMTRSFGELSTRLSDGMDAAAKRQSEGLGAVTGSVKEMSEANERRNESLALALTTSVKEMADASERRGDGLRQTVEGRLDALRAENGQKLEEMRVTVDEKLQGTLNERLGASFSMVNENLERVHKSVGEMQQIATGVGDLKRVLTNVKARGTWGETSLGLLLEQVMTPEQYARNVEVKPGSGCRVEYAIKMPGGGEDPIWLPIDAKLPTEDYERLVEASERGDAAAVEEAAKGLERAIRKCGQDIGTKYVDPPHSTDFGIMFLPTEGLFAEVVRRPGLVDALQREARVTVAGPTTLMATLVALRSGFRTLAIQQRSSEVWQVLGAVKTEFGKFGGVLDKVGKKLGEAQKVVEDAGVRRRAVDRKLRAVEALPETSSSALLTLLPDDAEGGEEADELEAAE